MKIDVDQEGVIVLREVFNSVVFEAEGGERLVVCMRDDAFEIAVINGSIKNPPHYPNIVYYQWYTASSRGIERQHLMAKQEAGNDNSS
jgi:hypothetical protein